jgi:hypothetical protein
MGFDIYWLNDPHGDQDYERVTEAATGGRPRPRTATEFAEFVDTYFGALKSLGTYYRAGSAKMSALVTEMSRQGMLGPGRIPADAFDANDGRTVSPAEIEAALAVASTEPTGLPEPRVSAFDDFIRQAAESTGVGHMSGREAVLALDEEKWTAIWEEWLGFLARAAGQGGGFRVW